MKKFLLTTACLTLATANANAGGFQLSEYSTTLIGRALAGYGVVGDDYSAAAFNPAGMTLKDSGFQAGLNVVGLHSVAKGSVDKAGLDGKSGRLEDTKAIPHFFGQYKLNDKTRVGFSLFTPFGFATNYNKTWFGRTHALRSEITVIDYQIAGSYDVADNITVGAGIAIETLSANLTNAADSVPAAMVDGTRSKLKGNSVKPAFNAGVLYKIDDDTRIGFSYRSKVDHKIKGKHNLNLTSVWGKVSLGDDGADLHLPEYYILSGYHKIGDFGLSASVKWTKWSRFETLDVYSRAKSPTNPTGAKKSVGAVKEEWRDTWTLALGTDYYYNDKLTYRAGIAFDQAGVKDAAHRTARVPDSDRLILGIGASYKFNEKSQLDFAYSHLFMKSAHSRNQLPNGGSTLNAKYNSNINMFGIAYQYNF